MGPRPRGRGITVASVNSSVSPDASMGPRPRGRGILRKRREANRHSMLQWGHDRAVVELTNGAAGSNGTNGTLQWGHDRAVVELRTYGRRWITPASFNGATTARSWNSCRRGATQEVERLASMGPRPRGRGIVCCTPAAST